MAILVREFEETDRNALHHVYLASRNATFTWNPVGLHQASDFDVHTEGEKILVALESENVVGFASIWQPDNFLHNLFVHPLAVRRGVGQALLAGCRRYFSGTPTLKCVKANVNATQFYRSQGWQTVREAEGPDGPYLLMEHAGFVYNPAYQ